MRRSPGLRSTFVTIMRPGIRISTQLGSLSPQISPQPSIDAHDTEMHVAEMVQEKDMEALDSAKSQQVGL